MARHSFIHHWTVGLGVGATAILLPGCWTHDCWLWLDPCATIPKGAIPDPVGTKVNWAAEAQAANAAEDDFVIYKHEWCENSAELGPYGKYHLGEIVKRLPGVSFCVVIQPSGLPYLDDARRQGLVVVLGMKGIEDAEKRVVVAFPKAEGLYGEEATRVYYHMLNPQGYHHSSGQGGYGGMGGVGGYGGYGAMGIGGGYSGSGRSGSRGGRF